jgi:hypothetical protein
MPSVDSLPSPVPVEAPATTLSYPILPPRVLSAGTEVWEPSLVPAHQDRRGLGGGRLGDSQPDNLFVSPTSVGEGPG